MCIYFKIIKLANKDKNKTKYQLGTFCEQYKLPQLLHQEEKINMVKRKNTKIQAKKKK